MPSVSFQSKGCLVWNMSVAKLMFKKKKKKVMRSYKGFQVRKFGENTVQKAVWGQVPSCFCDSVILLSDLPKSSQCILLAASASSDITCEGVSVNEDLGRATGPSLVGSDGMVSKCGFRVFVRDLFESAGETCGLVCSTTVGCR